LVEVGKRERRRRDCDGFEVDFRMRVSDLCGYGGRAVWVGRVEVEERRWF